MVTLTYLLNIVNESGTEKRKSLVHEVHSVIRWCYFPGHNIKSETQLCLAFCVVPGKGLGHKTSPHKFVDKVLRPRIQVLKQVTQVTCFIMLVK